MEQELSVRLTANGDGLVGAFRGSSAAADDSTKSLAAMREEAARTNAELARMAAAFKAQQSGARANKEDIGALDDELASFMSKLSPAYTAVKQLDTGHDLLSRSLAAGLLTQQQYDRGLANLTAKYGPAAAGAAALTAGHEALGTQSAYTTHRVVALFDELAGGRPRQAVGTLASLSFHMGGIGLAGLAAVAGIAAVFGTFAYGVYQAEQGQRALNAVEVQFAATGRAALLSRDQVKMMADQLVLLPGMSRSSALATVAALASVPTLTAPLLKQLSGVVDDFAFATGSDAPKAAQALARALEDPLKGAQALDKQFNILTADQELQIESLMRQGRIYDAQQIIVKALQDRFTGLHDAALTPLQKTTNDLGNAWELLKQRMGDSSFLQGAYAAVVSVVAGAAKVVQDTQHGFLYGTSFNPAVPQSAPGAAAGAATGPTWDQQHQAYVAGLNTEVKAALEAGKAYSNTADQMQRLRELRQQLRSAELAAAFAGDTKAVAELRRELIGVNAALGAPQLQSLIAYSEAFQKDTEAGIAGGVAQGDKYMQSWYGLRQQSAQTRNATIADPAARARAQLNAEIELKREELATVTDANGERKQLQDELDNWIVARDAQLAEQLKPQWQKNLDAWSDMTRGMRDRFDEFQLSIQQAGEQVAIAFGRTGHFSGQALVQAFEDEISKSIYRQYFAPLVSQASGAIGGAIFGQSGSADYFGGANFTYGFHTGGIVGSEGTARSIAAGAFAGAPRFHSGVGPGEMAAILKKDEGVFTPGQMRALGAGASRPTSVVVNLNNQSGVQLNAQASAPRMDGENMVVDLLIKRLSRDAGARDQVNSLLKAPT